MNQDELDALNWKIARDQSLLKSGTNMKVAKKFKKGEMWSDEMLYAFELGIVRGCQWVRDDMSKCILDVKAGMASQTRQVDGKQ